MQLLCINELWRPISAKPDPFASPQSHCGVTEIQLVTPQRESQFRKDVFYGFCFCLKKKIVLSHKSCSQFLYIHSSTFSASLRKCSPL